MDGGRIVVAGRRDVCGVSQKITGVRQISSGVLRKSEENDRSARIVCAEEELKRALLKNEMLMTTRNGYKVQMRDLVKKQEEEELKEMAILQELEKMKQNVEQLKSQNKLRTRAVKILLDSTIRRGKSSMTFMDLVVK